MLVTVLGRLSEMPFRAWKEHMIGKIEEQIERIRHTANADTQRM